MAENRVKVEQVYNDKPGRYDEPIGNQILGVSLGTVKLTNVGKIGRAHRLVPVQQAHVTCCHVSNDRLLSNR